MVEGNLSQVQFDLWTCQEQWEHLQAEHRLDGSCSFLSLLSESSAIGFRHKLCSVVLCGARSCIQCSLWAPSSSGYSMALLHISASQQDPGRCVLAQLCYRYHLFTGIEENPVPWLGLFVQLPTLPHLPPKISAKHRHAKIFQTNYCAIHRSLPGLIAQVALLALHLL